MSESVRLRTVSRQRRQRSFADRCADVLCDMRCLVAITLLTIAIFISILVVGMSAQSVRDMPSFGPMIIDTDAGIDDAMALMMALETEKRFFQPDSGIGPKLLAITTVNGNTYVENVSKNVLRILGIENRTDIPVFQGASKAIKYTRDVTNYFGVDGLGDVPDPNAPSIELLQKTHAAVALVELVNKYIGEISLFCMGPLTNVALAIRLDEEFLTKLKHIYILGGSTKGLGNADTGIEFNFQCDPEANYIVLKDAERRNDTVTLLTVEPSVDLDITLEWRATVLGKLTSQRMQFLNSIEHIDSSVVKEGAWEIADQLLMAIAIDPKLVLKKYNLGLVVVTEGEFRGGVLADYIGIHKNGRKVELIDSVNREGFKKLLLDYLGS